MEATKQSRKDEKKASKKRSRPQGELDSPISDLQPKKPRHDSAAINSKDSGGTQTPATETCEICDKFFMASKNNEIKDSINEKIRSVCRPCKKAMRSCAKCKCRIRISWDETGRLNDCCKNHQDLICEACETSFTPQPKGQSYDYLGGRLRAMCEPCHEEETEHLCDYTNEYIC